MRKADGHVHGAVGMLTSTEPLLLTPCPGQRSAEVLPLVVGLTAD